MAGFNKRPFYHVTTERQESEFFESTPKHVMYAALRALACRLDPESADEAFETGRWLDIVRAEIQFQRDGHLIP